MYFDHTDINVVVNNYISTDKYIVMTYAHSVLMDTLGKYLTFDSENLQESQSLGNS